MKGMSGKTKNPAWRTKLLSRIAKRLRKMRRIIRLMELREHT